LSFVNKELLRVLIVHDFPVLKKKHHKMRTALPALDSGALAIFYYLKERPKTNEILQVFYGRETELERIKNHMLSDCEKPMVLYGEGGCGKTSLLAKSAGLASTEWFEGAKPINIIRFLGTTPDSSALAPTLVSICQQVRCV